MKQFALTLIALTILTPFILWATFGLWGEMYTTSLLKPKHRFSEDSITVPPDYSSDRYWASLPGAEGLANLTPQNEAPREGRASTAVFYIHPTSYLSGKRWNAPLFAGSWAWEMVDRMMATQASAYNGCCDVYAPHYREATLWSFIERDTQEGQAALNFAYEDVATSFEEFLRRFSDGRPFIIASHSQGTAHALRLLSERVNSTALRERLVAAYLIGYQLPLDYFDRELTNIPPCETASETGCVVHWATYGEDGLPEVSAPHYYSGGWEYAEHKRVLCTNPLSWRVDEKKVPAEQHPGALEVSGAYGMFNVLFNTPSGKAINFLPAVSPKWTWAQCREGFLYVAPQEDGPFASPLDDEKRNYHTRDYSLFYQAIRDNAILRVGQYNLEH